MTEGSATRLYLPHTLAPGVTVELDPSQVHRLLHVLRLGTGAAVNGFNEQNGEWLCTLAELGRGRGSVSAIERLRPPEREADIWLLFAPIRRTRLDWLVEKATELGAAALCPVWTARTQPERLNRERLHAIAISAAEQSKRLSVPEIREPEKIDHLLADWPPTRQLIVCDETGGGVPIAEVLAALPPEAAAALLIGPEGGFAETELDALGKLPIVSRVGLGPRVLRAETAALAALAAYQALAGDGRRARLR